MANDFIRKNTPALSQKVVTTMTGDYGSYEAMKAALRNALDLPSPIHETMSMPPVPIAAQQEVSPLPMDPSKHTHMRIVYPFGNSRFEIYSDSEEGLDSQEQKIRALFPQQ